MPKTKPRKTELARFQALNELGLSAHAIASKTGRDPKTIRKYLHSDLLDDPAIKAMVDKIKDTELNDLYLLGQKARYRLHELLDEGQTKVIETTAVMDRSFQQRRLLEGQSTQIVDYHDVTAKMSALDDEIARLKRELGESEDIIDITPDRKSQPQEILHDKN